MDGIKKIEILSEPCYNERHIMREKVKFGASCAFSAVSVAALIVGVTLGILHFNNSSGKGGFSRPGVAEFVQDSINQEVSENSVSDSESDINLSYITYRVKKGDMIGYIADDFGVTQDTIISVNNIRASRLIQIGQYLKIPSMPGIMYTVREGGETVGSIAEKYKVDAVKCASVNNLALDQQLDAGKTLFVPDAAMDWVTRQEINGDLFIKPLHNRFYFTSYYGWRSNPFDSSRRTYHNGIDMACAKGTPIYAALSGVVTAVGWSDVYGNYVIVSHHSGYKTLYAHMSATLVTRGQSVSTSTRIGKVGSTGMSTGPHLHFTVYKNGRTVNPANLWK